MKRIIVTIDGHSSTGKSTVARQLAAELGYAYIDSGAMYRAVTLFVVQKGLIDSGAFDQEGLIQELPQMQIKFAWKNGSNKTFLNDLDVSDSIRTMEISELVSRVAAMPEVRAKMVEIQRSFGLEKGVVMDGRDIGSVVFPQAELKLFMTASAQVRAKRRFDELTTAGQDVSFESVLENLTLRDNMDSKRSISPLIIPEGAIVIDNSEMNQHDQFNMIVQLAKDRIYGRI
ncbi:MAG: (d)CMP kinase [Flavobacteriaceae bacterium]|nr:(d)CMP kinase [Flavobacteriaceae bacterium]